MNLHASRLALLSLGTALSLVTANAGIVRFTATINAEQETTGSDSDATGTAILLYDVTNNTFDLVVTVDGFANPLTLSHIHEAAPGEAGPPVVDFGAGEDSYTRDGDTLSGTFSGLEYTGDPATLLAGGAYLNYHSDDWPGGEVRGQLIPDPVKLHAILTPDQEVGAHAPVDSDAYGAAQAIYDPTTDEITVLVCVYNFANTLADSHIHEAPIGASGGVKVGFGGADQYINNGTTYVQVFSNTYQASATNPVGGDPLLLLSEGAYVNVHSNVYGPGEIRGQLFVQDPTNAGRLVNVSSRAMIGTGDNVLISGFYVQGEGPARVLLTGRGPGMANFVDGTLENPSLEIHDADGNLLFTNDDVGDAPFQELIEEFNAVSLQESEAGVLLILPPGGYTGIVRGVDDTTGIGLAEAFEVNW